MSFITRAALRAGRGAQRNLVSLLLDGSRGDAAHRLIWSLFADDEAKRDFLYREIEPGRYLIVSAREPLDPSGLWRLEIKPYAPTFESGQRLAFSLRANPAVRVRGQPDASGRGRRADAVMHAKTAARAAGERFEREEQSAAALQWLKTREDNLGVRLDPLRCAATGYERRRIAREGAREISFRVVDYEGALEVSEPARLTRALTGGVGAAKAFGCGLLLVRPDYGHVAGELSDED